MVEPESPAAATPHLLPFMVFAANQTVQVAITDNNGRAETVTFAITSDSSGEQCGARHNPHHHRPLAPRRVVRR